MPLIDAVKISDFIVTVSGDKHVVDKRHMEVMKDGCVMANSGHFNVEINIPALEALSIEKHRCREYVDEYRLPDGRHLRLLAEGRLVNLSAAEGHPAAVMDMSFANQALAVAFLAKQGKQLEHTVHSVPDNIDKEVALLKLQSMNIGIDTLTAEQQSYLSSWREGT
jgi:adenosylhomocysteinase